MSRMLLQHAWRLNLRFERVMLILKLANVPVANG